jgi:hypothetical protein
MTPFDARSVAQPRRQRQREFGTVAMLLKDEVSVVSPLFSPRHETFIPRITFILNWIYSS